MKTLSRDHIIIHHEIPPKMLPNDRVAVDTELFGMEKKKLHRPGGKFASLACTADGTNVYMVFDEKQVAPFYENIDPAVHIYQNMAFDIRQMRRFADLPDRKKVWDTMLIEQIMWHGYYNDFALND